MDPVLALVLALVLLIIIVLVVMAVTTRPEPSPRPRPRPYPVPVPVVGGCAGTRYGCCPDGTTAKSNYFGTNCDRPYPFPWPFPRPPHYRPHHHPRPQHTIIGGCAGTRWGCCPNSSVAKANRHGTNC